MAAATFMTGCHMPPDSANSRQVMELRESWGHIQPGMTKDDVLSRIPNVGMRSMVGTTVLDGDRLEEWAITAAHYGSMGTQMQRTERYLYFINDVLADMSTEKLAYRDRQALVIEWRNR